MVWTGLSAVGLHQGIAQESLVLCSERQETAWVSFSAFNSACPHHPAPWPFTEVPRVWSNENECYQESGLNARGHLFTSWDYCEDKWDNMEKEMATHSSILAWRIPWTEEPGGLQTTRVTKSWTWPSIHTKEIIGVLVCSGCHNNVSQTGWFKKQKTVFSQFWSW